MVKVISLSNDAYETLKKIKNGRSFSETIMKLMESRADANLMDFFGIWKSEDTKKIKNMIKKDRKTSKLREVKF